jgi:hypothetical protein
VSDEIHDEGALVERAAATRDAYGALVKRYSWRGPGRDRDHGFGR